jgi:DNA repair exonuclease SbcCD nuclease subunit
MCCYTEHVRPATILHLADVHLGVGRGAGLEETAFDRAIDFAIEADVDAVLVAGDLFDHGRVPDELLAWTAKELDRVGRPVVLLVGNHDPLNDASVHHRFRSEERCAQVLMLDDPDGSLVEVPGTDVVVWGRAMVEHEPNFRPLAGVPSKPDGRWGVVACHGLALDAERATHHSSPIAPSELAALDWDYVALGHHHGHKVVRESPCPVVYPGATALRRGTGEARIVLVEFHSEIGATFESVSLALA